MSIAAVTGYQPPIAAAPRAERDDAPVERSDDKSPADKTSSAQFSALLALLAGNGHRLRADVLRKGSPDDVALLDRLLNGSLGSADIKQVNDHSTATDTGTSATANTSATVDAVRYGMLTDLANGVLSSVVTPTATGTTEADAVRIVPPVTGKTKKVARHGASDAALSGLARALESGKPSGLFARGTGSRGGSVEELMALGDKHGANARFMIDAVLNTAGTPEGTTIADAGFSAERTSVTIAEMLKFASALAAAQATSAADPSTPVADTDALQPELRTRLDRVIARMRDEFNHDVQIVETARSPERQEQLFAQGRTTPGDVVTWTHDSAHLRGAAADVVVDGSWNNPEGFALLQRIAREEGLRTLGARDPGHLELAHGDTTIDLAQSGILKRGGSPEIGDANGGSGVAGVARVAGVASVAQVAVPTRSVRAGTEPAVDGNDRAPANASLGVLAQSVARGANSEASNGSRRDESRDGARDGVREHARDAKASNNRDGAFPAYGDAQNAPGMRNFSANATERPQPSSGVDAAQRVADATALRDDARPKTLSQMTLEVEGPGGDAQRITVDMRGNAVSTHINTDTASADRMRARVGELQGALEQHGLQSEAVRITSPAARTIDAAEQVKQATSAGERDALRLAGANGSAAGDGASQQGLRDRPGAARDWEKHNDARSARDEQRQGNSQRNRRGPNYEEL